MARTSVNSVSQITDQILDSLHAPCKGCNLRVIADKNEWKGTTLKLPSGRYTYLGYEDGERGVQQEALCRFHGLSADTLCEECAGLHSHLLNFGAKNQPKI